MAANVEDNDVCDMEERAGVLAAGVEVPPSSASGTDEYRTSIARLTRLPPVRLEMAQFMTAAPHAAETRHEQRPKATDGTATKCNTTRAQN